MSLPAQFDRSILGSGQTIVTLLPGGLLIPFRGMLPNAVIGLPCSFQNQRAR